MLPVETLAQLRLLEKIGLKTTEDQERVAKLIQVSNVDYDHCDPESFKLINSLVGKEGREDKTIVPYLDACAQQHFSACAYEFSTQLEDAILRLDVDLRFQLNRLRSACTLGKHHIALRTFEPKELKVCLEKFFDNNSGNVPSTENSGSNEVPAKSSQMDEIVRTCSRVIEATGPARDNYKAVVGRPNLARSIERSIREWLVDLYLCESIIASSQLKSN